MKTILSFLLIIATSSVWADEIFPFGCKPVVVKDETLVLKAPKPSLVMIHNLAKGDLWITHAVAEPSASAGWSSRLEAGKWSGLALYDKSFELNCIESKPGHEQQVPCAGVLAVCEWSDLKMPGEETATYWAGEDMVLSALTAHIARRGFVVPTPAQ